MDFNLEEYRKIIRALKSKAYRFLKYQDAVDNPTGSSYVLLRHDIDFDLIDASTIAKVDEEENVVSTFFFLIRSPLYNLFSFEAINLLSEIKKMGHEIGLHIDQSFYQNLEDGIRVEIATASRLIPFLEPKIISFHRPHNLDELRRIKVDGVYQTHQAEFSDNASYISDARGQWRYGYPLDSAAYLAGRPLQLSLHPLWWVREGNSPLEKFSSLINSQKEVMVSKLRSTVSFPVEIE